MRDLEEQPFRERGAMRRHQLIVPIVQHPHAEFETRIVPSLQWLNQKPVVMSHGIGDAPEAEFLAGTRTSWKRRADGTRSFI